MTLLLDTHAYLWFTLDQPGLSEGALRLVRDTSNRVFVSPASYWEIAIKISKGQYKLGLDFSEFWHQTTEVNSIQVLPIEINHARQVIDLPHCHKDPFDRMIVAQALYEKMTLVSTDTLLDQYGVWRIG